MGRGGERACCRIALFPRMRATEVAVGFALLCAATPSAAQSNKLLCPAGTHAVRQTADSGYSETCEDAYKVRSGPFLARDASGRKRIEGSYRSGKENGTWKEWHDNGKEASEVTYEEGQAAGPFQEWYPVDQILF